MDRLRFTLADANSVRRFVIRGEDGSVRMMNESGIPLSLNNLTDRAAELMFELQDCAGPIDGVEILRRYCPADYRVAQWVPYR